MKKKNYLALFISVMVVAMALAGCGSSSYNKAMESFAEDSYDYYEEPVAAYDGGYAEEEMYSDDIYEAKMATSDESASAENGELSEEQLEKSSSNRKLIKNVNMSVQTKEFDALIETVTNKIDALGGYAEELNVSGYSYDASSRSTRSAFVTARIPAAKLDAFVSTVSNNSNIISKNESTNDVTLEYSDVEARRNSLRIEQERLNELLKQAENIDVIIELENRLTDVRYELESYESRLRNIDNKVDYSTVYLDIQEVKDYTPVVTPEKTFGQRVAEGFLSGCSDALEGFQDFIIGFLTMLPGLIVFLLILAIIAFIIFLIVKLIIKLVKKTQAKKTVKKVNAAPMASVAPKTPVTQVQPETATKTEKND